MSAVVFSDNMDSGAGWGVNAITADNAATFGYDYSADGIPEAPNSVGGAATSGVKLESNITAGALDGFTLYPIGQSFSGAYTLQFDAWMNFDADERVGDANGTTEFLGGGIGYNNTSADIGSGAQAITTGEGGSGSDWRVFKSPPAFFLPAAAMTAGDRNGSNAHYSNYLTGSILPPVEQGQTGLFGSVAGSPGLQWITWLISTDGSGIVNIDIRKPGSPNLRIATLDCNDTSDGSSGCTTDGNISLFYADFFSSVSPRPDLTFGVIDNVVVSDIPEPASVALMGLGGLAMIRRKR
jgi:hypothetical protein